MSSHNLRILVRNLKEREQEKLFYKNRSSSWKTIFKHHPLESKKNEQLFMNMVHCIDNWGGKDDPIVILRSGYTWDHLLEISSNSLQDCLTFYEIAKNTILYKKSLLDDSSNNWFKQALSAIYLSRENAPENLNFLSELKEDKKEKTLALAFQYFGVDVLPKYEKLKNQFNNEKIKEKLIFWYWDVAPKTSNLLDKVIDNLNSKDNKGYDLEYLANHLKPNNLFKKQSEEINKRFFKFNDLIVKTERYVSKSEKVYCVINEEVETTNLQNIYNLFCCQNLIKALEPEIKKYPKVEDLNKISMNTFLDTSKINSTLDIFNAYPIDTESKKSMEEFIELNKSKSKNENYWNEVQAVFLSKVLEMDLDKNNNIQKKLKI